MGNLPKQNRLPDHVRDVIRGYLRSHSKTRPVVVSEAMSAIRQAGPSIALTDEELRNDVAIAAIDAGFNIHFDGRETH